MINLLSQTTEAEHPEKYDWWLNELDSLGISTLQKNGLGNQKEASGLTEAVKQTLYEDYICRASGFCIQQVVACTYWDSIFCFNRNKLLQLQLHLLLQF
jgi:hypothetical protein